jgi:RNA polymerase sigma-70 factor, ECF subfamily
MTAAPTAEGSGMTFEEFFRAEFRSVMRALVLVTGDPSLAEELAQEAFARAFERWGYVERMASPAGYVYRSALNLNRSRLRRVALGVRLVRRQRPMRQEEPDPSRAHELRDMLRSLPRTQREALMLVDWLGYTAEEAAGLLGVRPASVRGRLLRARRALRNTFGGDDA